MKIEGALLGILVTSTLAASVGAQGLGDAAKRETERRKAAQEKAAPSKSYTDQDLPSSQAAAPAGEEAPEASAEGTEAVAAPEGGGVVFGGIPMGGKGRKVGAAAPAGYKEQEEARESARASSSYGNHPGSEASWRSAASAARRRIQTAEKRVQELDGKAAGLMYAPTGDCNLGSAGAHMSKEELLKYKCVDPVASWQGERQRTLTELDQAKAELDKARKALDTLEESARKQGALPGWLRE
jgi:hypothetical protein